MLTAQCEQWDLYREQPRFHEEVAFRLRFRDPGLEKKCREELHAVNMISGTWTLLYINLAWLGAVVAGTVVSRIRCGSGTHLRPFALGPVGLVSWMVFLGITTAVSVRNLQKPLLSRYMPLALLYYIWFVVVSKEPFAEDCREYIVPDKVCEIQLGIASHEGDLAPLLVRHMFDCSPEANSPLFGMFFLLAFSPRIMLDFRCMWLIWLWMTFIAIFIIFGRSEYRSEFFNPRETLAKFSVLCVATIEVMCKKHHLERSQRKLFISDMKHKEASQRIFEILEYMLPEHVLGPLLQNPDVVIAENASCVSVLFIMIADFEAHASSMTPQMLLNFLNQHFSRLDTICCEHQVTKIETIGEEYVAAVGVVPADVRLNKDKGHHVLLGRLMQMVTSILRSEGTDGVQFKMGIHTGPIVAGVIGQKLPRFRLFGDTINTAARMMQKGLAGRCQFGEATRRHLPEGFSAEKRGELEMKGKGLVQAYLLDVPDRTPSKVSPLSMAKDQLRLSRTAAGVSRSAASGPGRKRKPPLVQKILGAEGGPRLAYHAPDSFFSDHAHSRDCEELELHITEPAAGRCAELNANSRRHSLPPWAVLPGTEATQNGATGDVRRQSIDATLAAAAAPLVNAADGVPGSAAATCADEPEVAPRRRARAKTTAGPRTRSVAQRARFVVQGAGADGQGGTCGDAAVPLGVRRGSSMRKFSCLLQEVTSSFPSQDDSPRSRSRSFSIRLFKNCFAPDMERLWYQWFHNTEICEKLPIFLPRQLLVFAFLTFTEACVMHDAMTASTHHEVFQGYRFIAFVSCRGLIVAILGAWWSTAKTHMRCMRSHPSLVQWLLLFSHAIIGLCIFLSYDTLTPPDEVILCNNTIVCTQQLKEAAKISASQSLLTGECWSLVFAIVYSFWMTWQNMLFIHACGVVVITFSIMVVAGTEAFRKNFYISAEAAGCFVLCFVIQATIAYTAEEASRSRFKTRCALEFMDQRIEDILNTLMPSGVVNELRSTPANMLSHHYSQMTLAQSDLVGFTKLASTCSPSRVVEIVSSLFGRFDELTDQYGIYKVETVGDAYIAGQADWPLTAVNSPTSVVRFALGMVKATNEWASKQALAVGCRVGVHTGECIGGVVGTEMQRYHIFGAIMHHLELLESTAPSGRVQVSKACREAVAQEMQQDRRSPSEKAVSFEERQDERLCTSKGDVVQYHQVGGKTCLVVA